ncbi:exonuclease SbcCD subunit D [Anaeromicropila populeti]|uniref:Nuclease SbcCD subunit D n=1 Tax=Anaeromicropila populeti TaxID=37658 RepID=A0A1I6IQ21_9FIRM|nr:exonuclease SbcCD subunit D [Anaeromicropila populeti]SFR68751.1 Exodeoxyribonuclease I subunit D [Anaeromicropila populeti]
MRILHTSDWHLGKYLDGNSRLWEQERFLEDFVKLVEEKKVDLVIIAGDIYDTANPPAKAEQLFYDTLKKLSRDGERVTLVIAGNHDSPERLVAAGPLAREHGIIMLGTPKAIAQTGTYGKHKITESGEGYFKLQIGEEQAVIVTIPFPSEKRLEEMIYTEMSEEEEKLKSYGERLKQLMDSLAVHYQEDTINLLTAHLFVAWIEESGSERSISLGGSYIVDSKCFPKQAQYIALGHIHRPQIVPGTEKRARYAGAPLHYHKGEAAFQKKVFLVEVQAGEPCQVEEIPLNTYKPIEIWKCNAFEEAVRKCMENSNRQCWVYLEIKTETFITEQEIKQLKSIKDDILEIIPIFPRLETASEEALNFAEKPFEEVFREFFIREKGGEPEPELVELLLKIVSEEDEDEAACIKNKGNK